MHNAQILCLTPTHSLVKQPHLKQHLKTRIMTLCYHELPTSDSLDCTL